MLKLFITFISFILCIPLHALPISAESIIKEADAVRNPSDSFFMKVEVASGSNKKCFDVFVKDGNKTLIKTKAPRRDIGRNLLMIDEKMWAYIPNLRRSVRVGLSQKLTGQAANGDISRLRWSGDYKGTIEKEDKVSWIIYLKAIKKGLTYEQIRVKIMKKNYHPVSAQYLTINSRPLKNVTYTGYKKIAGKIRPTQIIIEDALSSSNNSTILIKEMKNQNMDNSIFHKSQLK